MLQLDYTRIAPNAPYLRMKDLRPGDVLLSRGKSHLKNRFEPALIALGTLGWYSHAAVFIWLKPPAEGAPGLLQLIESEDQGAGWTELTKFSLALDGKSFEDVAALPGAPVGAALFRHPEMASVPPETLVEASKRIGEQQLFMAYPPLVRLVDATPFPLFMKRVLRRAVAGEAKGHDPYASGSFCSQLVAQFFELLPIPLFAAPKLPQEVSPNDLVKSNLIEDADAIITKNMISKTAIANVVDLRDLVQSDSMRTSWLPYITEFKAFGKQADHVLRVKMAAFREDHAQRVGTFYVDQRWRIKNELESFPKSITTAFNAGDISDPKRNVWMDEMDDTLLYLASMDRVLDREDEKNDLDEHRRSVRLEFLRLQTLILTQLNVDWIEFWKDTVPPDQRPPELKAFIEKFDGHRPAFLQQMKELSAEIPASIDQLGAKDEIAGLLAETNQELKSSLRPS